MTMINLRRVRLSIFKVISTCVISLWKLLAYFGKINVIKNGVVYPRFGADRPLEFAKLTKNFGYECIERMSNVLEKHGDYDCLINGYFYLHGKTTSCGEKSKTLSSLITDSRILGKVIDTKYRQVCHSKNCEPTIL